MSLKHLINNWVAPMKVNSSVVNSSNPNCAFTYRYTLFLSMLNLKTYYFSTQPTIYLIITNTLKMLEICRQDIVFWAHGVYHGDLLHVGVVGDGHVGADPSVLQDTSFRGVCLCWVAPSSQWVGFWAAKEGQKNLPELEVLKQNQSYNHLLFNFFLTHHT